MSVGYMSKDDIRQAALDSLASATSCLRGMSGAEAGKAHALIGTAYARLYAAEVERDKR